MAKWDHAMVVVEFGERQITCWASGSTIEPFLAVPARFNPKHGHGRTIQVQSKVTYGGAKLTLLADGPDNDFLANAHAIDQLPGQKWVRPFLVKDLQGNQLVFCPKARIVEVSMPTMGDEDGPANREWTIAGDPCVMVAGAVEQD
jgi:hypothetical protein